MMLSRKSFFINSIGIYLIFLFLFITPGFAFSENDSLNKKSISKEITQNSSHDIRIGERIFYGLIPSGSKTINCASCHNVDHIDTFNWNPSALDIALKFAGKDFETFKSVVIDPTGLKMTDINDSMQFSDQQLHQLKNYLDELAKTGEEPTKPLLTNRIIFIILILLFALTIIDLTLTKKIRIKLIHTIVLIILIFLITNYISGAAIGLGRSENYQPDQPIKFSHKVHAGQNKTNCLYCHFNAEHSKYAGIPPVSVCMNCHIIVGEGARSGKFEINKIYQAIQNNMPIQWVKVHNLPDYVFFSHAQHVAVGKIDCLKCHGDIAKMDQIVQVHDLSMGWCVNCHRETGVQFDNKFYEKYEKLHRDLKKGKIKKVTVEQIGGIDCMKCHY